MWSNKKPPAPGWYLCECDWWRWWDGKCWSFGVKSTATAREAARLAKSPASPLYQMAYLWSDFYPKNARIQRLDGIQAVEKAKEGS
jgi:hypothetical protein